MGGSKSFVLIVLSVLYLLCANVNGNLIFERIAPFDDRQIKDTYLWEMNNVPIIKCAYTCYKDTQCFGIQFSELGSVCLGLSQRFEGSSVETDPSPGFRLWQTIDRSDMPCVDDSSCQPLANSHCHEGGCRCDIGYGGQGNICRSLAECSVFGIGFTEFPGYYVMGHNLDTASAGNTEECKDFCKTLPTCKNADYILSIGNCLAAELTWLEFPDGHASNDNDYIHLQRDCVTWQP